MGGRDVRRVARDFAWPLGERWVGYVGRVPCPACAGRCRPGGAPCPACRGEGWEPGPRVEPPAGDGWQLWETTSEGTPASPVFDTAEALCAWCEGHATFFGGWGGSAADWMRYAAGESHRLDLGTGAMAWSGGARSPGRWVGTRREREGRGG